ncbi:MAG: hypothetical protein ACRD1T_24540 [Acidimicrobiia bacterium]
MAERINDDTAHVRVKVWREVNGRIHVVGDDPDVPANGFHANPARDSDSFKNLHQLLDNLASQEG